MKNYVRFTINGEDAAGFTIKTGKDYTCLLVIQGADQTGATIKFVAKKDIKDPDAAAILTKSGTDMTTTIGTNVLTSTFQISGADTENLNDGLLLVFGIQRTINGKDEMVVEGKMQIENAVIF